MKPFIHALLIVLLLSLAGCASAEKYLGTTEAHFGNDWYKSNKNQENFNAEMDLDANGKPTKIKVSTTATTPESAIAAAAQANLEAMKLISALVDKLMAGAKAGALSGS